MLQQAHSDSAVAYAQHLFPPLYVLSFFALSLFLSCLLEGFSIPCPVFQLSNLDHVLLLLLLLCFKLQLLSFFFLGPYCCSIKILKREGNSQVCAVFLRNNRRVSQSNVKVSENLANVKHRSLFCFQIE